MAKYVTIDIFKDMDDEGVEYPIGAIYPREGYEPSPERIKSFLDGSNAKGVPIIKPLVELPAKGAVDAQEEPENEPVELSRDELKAKLDELGVEYAKNAKTEILAELLAAQEGE